MKDTANNWYSSTFNMMQAITRCLTHLENCAITPSHFSVRALSRQVPGRQGAPSTATVKTDMNLNLSRRQFVRNAAALSMVPLLPRRLSAQPASPQRVLIRTDVDIGLVRPDFHGHFAEHLGSCIYGGLWVGKNS